MAYHQCLKRFFFRCPGLSSRSSSAAASSASMTATKASNSSSPTPRRNALTSNRKSLSCSEINPRISSRLKPASVQVLGRRNSFACSSSKSPSRTGDCRVVGAGFDPGLDAFQTDNVAAGEDLGGFPFALGGATGWEVGSVGV